MRRLPVLAMAVAVLITAGAVLAGVPAAAAAGPSGSLRSAGSLRLSEVEVASGLRPGFGDFEKGNRLYRDGRYAEAVAAYRSALEDGRDDPALHYNLGTALLRIGEYEAAERHLRQAMRTVEPELRPRVLYNLGNRYLQAARADSVPPEARSKLLDAAVESYRQTLRLAPSDSAAKWNYELALREREKQPQQQGGSQQQDRPGGGGEQDEPQPPQGGGAQNPKPPEADGRSGATPRQQPMTQEQADRILSAVEEDERELYREKLKKGRRETPVAKDW